ncbi:MAG: lytic transglycosylase domain-containing protein [Synergistaceae bacterium]|jgi:soluble lytic murein transglycosylase-like protein|nr:lytic transglycosylase domain-containing protein [Synergistaceae bacterium]
MKNLFLANFTAAGLGMRSSGARMIMIAVVIAIEAAALFASAASAEPERYDFPVYAQAARKMPPAGGNPAIRHSDRRKNEARRKSIAALLRQYNKKLSEEKAYEYAVLIIQTSDRFKQNPFVITAMVVNESSARHDAVSRGGDYGLMQVRWKVHQKAIRKKYPHIARANDMLNPRDNLQVGVEIFSNYRERADQDLHGALLSYSAGNRRLAQKIFAVFEKLEKSYIDRLNNSHLNNSNLNNS